MDLEPDDPDSVRIIAIKKAHVKNKFAKLETPDPRSKNISIHTFLKANIDRQVVLRTSSKDIKGNIKWIQGIDEADENGNFFVMIETGELNNKTDLVLNISRIDEIQGMTEAGQEDKEHVSGSSIDVAFKISGSANPTASLSYLAYNHVVWLPSYHITINPDTNCLSLQGKATFLCDPTFQKTVTIPEVILCAGKPSLENKSLNDSLVANSLPLAVISQNEDSAFLEKPDDGKSLDDVLKKLDNILKDESSEIDLKVIEDEFEYKLENVELTHGQPTSLNFMEPLINIPYEDVYHINVKWKPEVSKGISFRNFSDQHLTSGSVSIVSKSETNNNSQRSQQKFLNQSKLRFTAKRASVIIPMSPSTNILAKVSQEETEMKMEKIFKDWLKKFEVLTKVELENTLDEVSKCVVETNVPGELITSDPEVTQKRVSTMKKQYDLYATTQYIWEVSVGPKQKTELSFRFLRKEIMFDDEKIPALYT